jgi:UbiD family decarboxylase
MVHNEKELGTWIASARHARLHMKKYFEKKEEVPVVISLRNHPALFAMSGMEVPYGISEFNYLGAMLDMNWKVIEGPITGLPIPVDSEVVLEGYITNEMRDEGPFGEYCGY